MSGLVAPEAPQPSPAAWHAGAAGWEGLVAGFVRSELYKQSPDFRGFAERIAPFGDEVRHGAWIRVAQDAPTIMGRTRAYLEALAASPARDSLAWYWLTGEFDRGGLVLHVVGEGDDWTPATVERERRHLGTIVDEGGRPPLEMEIVDETVEAAHAQAEARLGAAFTAADESIVCAAADLVTEEAAAETPGQALAAIERSLPPGAEILTNDLVQASRTRRVVVVGGERPNLEPDEHVAGQRLVRAAEKGFLGLGKKPGRYELTIASAATVRIAYRRKAVVRYTLYRRTLMEGAAAG